MKASQITCAFLLFTALQAGATESASVERPDPQHNERNNISLRTLTGELQGTLLLPEGQAKPPVVLLIAGSGPTDRDGNTSLAQGKNDSLKRLAEALAQGGYASVRYDKRGVADSIPAGPRQTDLRFDGYVRDAAAWIGQLKADERFAGVAVVGHSEGSLIGMLATRQAGARAFVSIAGPARRASDVLREQLKGKFPPAVLARSEAILAALEQGDPVNEVPPQLEFLFKASTQPYLMSWFQYLPTAEFAKLTVPALVIQGDEDLQVGVDAAQALKQARPEASLVIIKGMNHVLKPVKRDAANALASYRDPTLPLAEGLSSAIKAFLAEAMKPAVGQP